jgi:hypothetical protein
MPRLYCEIKCCEICNEFVETTNKLVIIKNKHYHKDCIILCRSIRLPSVVHNIS